MKIRRFFAADMRRAIQRVRNEHGAEAVILSSRAVEGGVEIVSAVDYDHELMSQMLPGGGGAGASGDAGRSAIETSWTPDEAAAAGPEPSATAAASVAPASPTSASFDASAPSGVQASSAASASSEAQAPSPAPSAAASPFAASLPTATRPDSAARHTARPPVRRKKRPEPGMAEIQNELAAMKCLMREQLAQLSWADLKLCEPERALLATRVASLGLEPDLADALVAEVEHPEGDRAWREVVFGLARRLRVPKEDPIDAGGVFALIGPTGVGKTTTVAKLAARHCLRHGRESIALISTDTIRVGAQRQLDAFGAILGVPVRQAADSAELGRLLHSLRDRRLVLIDTAGMAARDRRLGQALGQLGASKDIRRYLVLPANMQASVMHDAVHAFGRSGLAGAVVTKVDEANGLGAALSVLIRHKLPAAWLGDGQRVPEDLRLARAMHLLRWAIEGESLSGDHGRDHEWGMRPPGGAFRAAEAAHAEV